VRVVVDTNVLLSALLWHGAPHQLIERVRDGAATLISSPILVAELSRVLRRPKFDAIRERSNIDPDRVVAELQQIAEIIDPAPLLTATSRDADDDAVLALAIAANADLIVTGDSDLLTLGTHAGIPIANPAEALDQLDRAGHREDQARDDQ
jgi:putative PIN family toxin of toxin-antitoxin system